MPDIMPPTPDLSGMNVAPNFGQPTSPNVTVADPGTTVNVGTQPTVMPTLDPGPQYIPYQEPQHESWWRQILSKTATSMAGDETWKVKKSPDGTVEMQRTPSTEGEKWGRIAATLLGGLAEGLPRSFGPAGAANAASAGIQTGLQAGQKNFQDADTQATAEQKQQEAAANNALLHQRHYMGMLASQQLKGQITDRDAQILSQYDEAISATPNARDFGTITGYNDLKRIHDSNPEFFKSHTNLQLKSLPVRAKDGSFELHAVATDPGWDMQRVGKGQYRLKLDVDPKTGEPSLTREEVAEGSDKNGSLALANTAEVAKFIDAHNKWTDSQTRKQVAYDREEDAKQRSQDRQDALDVRRDEIQARHAEAAENRDLRREIANANRPSPDDFANEIPAILRGDTKAPPPGSRSPVAMAKRQAVFDADPTYSDSRYDTVQNFRTKGDAENIKAIATAMAHAERAATNSQKLGFNISPEHWPTGAAAAYRQDAQFVVDEIGKAVKGGVLTQHEGDKRIADLHSPLQSVRDSALKESLVLLSGRVHAVAQKYRAGAGRPMSMDEFFDPDTQARLARIEGAQPQGGQSNNSAPQTKNRSIAAAMQLPINKGKTAEQVKADLIKYGYTPVP
jgi:hypothetical protein